MVQNMVFEYMDNNLENILRYYSKNQMSIPESNLLSYIYQTLLAT